MNYSEKLKDPRWQKKRLSVLEFHNWKCFFCGNSEETLHIHHFMYRASNPWDDDEGDLCSICESCHKIEHLKNEMTHLERTLYKLISIKCIDGQGSEDDVKLLRLAKKQILETYG